MSFSEDCVRFGDQLAKLVDAGVPVREAAAALGVSQQRAYVILRATGRPMGSPNPDVTGVDQAQLAAVFTETGSVNATAKALEVAHSTARRMLVELGLVDAARQQRGKPQQRARFFELVDSGWTVTQAAREVGCTRSRVLAGAVESLAAAICVLMPEYRCVSPMWAPCRGTHNR